MGTKLLRMTIASSDRKRILELADAVKTELCGREASLEESDKTKREITRQKKSQEIIQKRLSSYPPRYIQ